MKAPDKIYLYHNQLGDNLSSEWLPKRCWDDDVEYIRTDAFIEKACKFFAPYIQDNSGGYDRAKVIEDFRKHMEE